MERCVSGYSYIHKSKTNAVMPTGFITCILILILCPSVSSNAQPATLINKDYLASQIYAQQYVTNIQYIIKDNQQSTTERYHNISQQSNLADNFSVNDTSTVKYKKAWFFQLGGEVRLRYERIISPLWGEMPTDKGGYFQQRYYLHEDIHAGYHIRLFGQLNSSLENGRTLNPPPAIEDKLDINQLYLDIKFSIKHKDSLTLRTGRQEMTYGGARLVGTREPLNVRRGFDGFRAMFISHKWHIDAFATKPVKTENEIFDDAPDKNQTFWGMYAVDSMQAHPQTNLDVYYFGINRKIAAYDQDSGHEIRHTIGTKISGKKAAWDYNSDFIIQFGKFNKGNIFAWAVFTDQGYTIRYSSIHPRFGLRAEISSGDRNPLNPNLQTFNALFTKGAYFLEPSWVAPFNHIVIDPTVTLSIDNKLKIVADAGFFWRQSKYDGIYGNAANVERSGLTTNARYIGSQPELTAQWNINKYLTLVSIYSLFYPGAFLKKTGPAQQINYFTFWMTFSF